MLFPTHLVLGWFCARVGRVPAAPVIVGAALPDLIDKPLGAVTPLTFQTIGHSLLGLAIVAVLVARTRLPWGVLLGWVSHLAADVVQLTLNARRAHAIDVLLWPVRQPTPFVLADSPAPRLVVLEPVAAAVRDVPVPFLQSGYLSYYVGTVGVLGDLVVWVAAAALLVWRRW